MDNTASSTPGMRRGAVVKDTATSMFKLSP